MMTMTQCIQSKIITLHDAINDSPIYHAAALHFDKQLDVFSHWINDLAQQTKSYAEKLKQLNAETISLTNKLNPTAIVNDYLLDAKITGMAATHYGDALKTNLVFKLKTVSDLEGNFTQPILHFADQNIRDFKDFRNRHIRALKKYEGALARYADFNGDNGSPLLDSTTTQLDEARKTYVEMSSEHVLRIIKLRHELEHFLVQQFSTATTSRKEFYDDAQVWKQLDAILFSWTEWLAEDKRTSRLEIRKQQLAQQTLEREYLNGVQCKIGDIGKIKTQPTTCSKSGYLLVKSTDNISSSTSPWIRQWFFLHDGYFGSCKVTDPEVNASITVDNCLPLQSCQAKHVDTLNRRFCFEVTSLQQSYKSVFVLQAENEKDLTEWLAAFRSKPTQLSSPINSESTCNNNRPSSIVIGSYDSSNNRSQPRSPALLLSKSTPTTVVTTPTDIPVTLSTVYSSNSNKYNMSSSPTATMHSILSRPHSMVAASSHVKVTCTTPSATPLLLREITTELPRMEADNMGELSDSNKLWGSPRYVISRSIDNSSLHKKYQHVNSSTGDSVWPLTSKSIQPQNPEIPGYKTCLNEKNQELRNLFYGVSNAEVVIEVFMASYIKKKHLETKASDQCNDMGSLRSLDSGYYYGGCVYVTQDTFWFYSKTSFNCITSVVYKLKDIEGIQVNHHTRKMTIDIADGSDTFSPLIFSLAQDDPETVAKKLRFLAYNAKLDTPMQLENTYRKISDMSTPTPSLSSSISSSTTLSTEHHSLDDSTCSSISSSQNKGTPLGLSSRMSSSTTTATIDTTETLVASNSDTITTTAKNATLKKARSVAKHTTDPDAIPDHINKPTGSVTCCHEHLDRFDAEVELPISAKRLFELMFSDESTGPSTNGGVWNNKTEGIDGRDLRISRWECMDSDYHQQHGQQMKRILKYWMPVANPIVRIKEAEVVETQTLLKKDDYLCYVVQISTKTESLPFADAFVPSVRYCITYVSDSRCKLTCCLGVKWLKWIMAKMIVTRAALSGMSDSINVFVPILKEAANTIQISVDNIRQVGLNSTDADDDDDNFGRDSSITAITTTTTSILNTDITIKSTTTTDTTTNGPTHCNKQLNNAPSQPESEHSPTDKKIPVTVGSRNTPSEFYTGSITPITEMVIATTIDFTSTLKSKTTQLHQLVRKSLSDTSFGKAPTLVKTTLGVVWPVGLWIFSAIMIVYLVYAATYLAASLGARLNNSSLVTQNQVVVHAIYLRDLDEGFIKNSLQPPYSDSKSYNLFLESKQDGQRYKWYDARYYRLAQEYGIEHQQLGILRHGVIDMFQALNTADSHLLESEYLNWLLDNRQRCRDERKLVQQQTLDYNDTSSHLCDQINSQIGTYF
ncbi:unnamed protein product [Absidia cylindrospora]